MNLRAACNFLSLSLLLNILIGSGNAEGVNDATRSGQHPTSPILTIPQGTLQGISLTTRYNRSISGFLGIPYAQPPIGNLRFSNPVAADAWSGTLNASVDGNSCIQKGDVGDEDCLYLNVYTPRLPRSEESPLLPVMVWIHGGSFESGNCGLTSYGPGHLLDADVVLVSVNYRLGPLGFLSTGDEVAAGNWGFKDQVLALKWVQDNIAYFGGDPGQVTLFGESAGAAAVQLLALSDSTIGLFHKFISQSGASYRIWGHRARSSHANLARQLGEVLGCRTDTSTLLIDCLRKINASEIINTRSQFWAWDEYPTFLWGATDEPDIDGAFLTDTPANLLAAGKIRDLPSITGVVKDEGLLFMPGWLQDSDVFKEFIGNLDELLPIVLLYSNRVEDIPRYTAALKEFYFNNDLTTNRFQVWSKCLELISDALYMYPGYNALQKQAAFAKHATFFYSFEYHGTYGMSNVVDPTGTVLNNTVLHSDENFYLFPRLEPVLEVLPEQLSEADLRMMDTMVQLWTSFAINGTPTTTSMISNTTWVAYSSSEDNYLRIGSGSDPALDLRHGFLPDRMQFWQELIAGE